MNTKLLYRYVIDMREEVIEGDCADILAAVDTIARWV